MSKVNPCLCQSADFKTIYQKNLFNIVKCSKCSLIFLIPQPDDETLKNIYDKEYYSAWGIGEDGGFELIRSIKVATFNKLLEKIQSYTIVGRVLDVGCAMGHFLEAAQEKGWDVYGVELSEYAAKIAQRNFGEKVYNKTLEEVEFEDNFFDAVLFSDLLEHVKTPVSLLTEARRILKPKGILAIVTPNAQSLSCKLMRRHWNYFAQEHLYYFSPKTISRFLKQKSFEILEIRPAVKAFNYIYLSSQLKTHKVPIITPIIKLLDKILLTNSISRALFYAYAGEMLVLAKKMEMKQNEP